MFILSLWICESVKKSVKKSVTGVVESADANNEQRNQLIFWLIWNNFLAANYIYWHYTKAFWIIKFTLGIYSLSENYYNVESEPGFYLRGSSRLILSYGFATVNIFKFWSKYHVTIGYQAFYQKFIIRLWTLRKTLFYNMNFI